MPFRELHFPVRSRKLNLNSSHERHPVSCRKPSRGKTGPGARKDFRHQSCKCWQCVWMPASYAPASLRSCPSRDTPSPLLMSTLPECRLGTDRLGRHSSRVTLKQAETDPFRHRNRSVSPVVDHSSLLHSNLLRLPKRDPATRPRTAASDPPSSFWPR